MKAKPWTEELVIFFKVTTKTDMSCTKLTKYMCCGYDFNPLILKPLTPQHPPENDFRAGDAVEDAEETDIPLSSVSIGGRPLCNLRFADDIDQLWSNEEELQQLTERLAKTAAGYAIEISSDKSKIFDNSIKQRPIANMWVNGQTLEEVDQFKYLSTHTKDGTSVTEIKIGLAQAHSALTMLWKTKPSVFLERLNSTSSHLSCQFCSLWMWELGIDGGSGEASPGLWKQIQQENDRHIIQRA